MTLQGTGEPIKRVLVRCDGAPEIGFGHVVRCLALADELRDQHGCEVAFAMLQGPQGVEQIQAKGFTVHQPVWASSSCLDEGEWLRSLTHQTNAQVLVLDVRTDLSVDAIQHIRATGVLIVIIDDGSERRLAADLAFYPPVPQVERLDWTGFTGKRFVGWEWVLLRPEFARLRQRMDRQRADGETETNAPQPLNILVTMGGSDPARFTLMALKALDQIEQDIQVEVVLGSGYMHEAALQRWLAQARRNYEIRRDVQNMPAVMAEADLAIASFGTTAYELAVMGVPSILYSLSEDHEISAKAFVQAGFGISLGYYVTMPARQDIEQINRFLQDLYSFFPKKEFFFDGFGVVRIANIIERVSLDIGDI